MIYLTDDPRQQQQQQQDRRKSGAGGHPVMYYTGTFGPSSSTPNSSEISHRKFGMNNNSRG
jgi:hypothetical protein